MLKDVINTIKSNARRSSFTDYFNIPFDHSQTLPVGAKEVMAKCSQALAEIGQKHYLATGTALGVYREGNFIKHDSDIDIDMIGDVDCKAINNAITGIGMTLGRKVTYKGKITQLVYYSADKVILDINIWYQRGKYIYSHVPELLFRARKHHTKYYEHSKEVIFNNRTYLLPAPTEEWLTLQYGKDWKIPKKYKRHWSKEAHDIVWDLDIVDLLLVLFKMVQNRISRYLRFVRRNIANIFYTIQNKHVGVIRYRDLSADERQLLLSDDWYHDFGYFGVKTYFRDKVSRLNQESKQEVIFSLIDKAIDLCGDNNTICGIELFCADGFYSNYAIKKGVSKMTGIDIEMDEAGGRGALSYARLMSKILGHIENTKYENRSVFNINGSYDIVICAGGLYHISNPKELLESLKKHTKKALVIQTVYSLESNDESYFESPCPGWSWGCRFSYKYLINMVKSAGWVIAEERSNELKGNLLSRDRGSAYLLCLPQNRVA